MDKTTECMGYQGRRGGARAREGDFEAVGTLEARGRLATGEGGEIRDSR